MTAILYEIQPLDPTGNDFWTATVVTGIPVGNLALNFPELDHLHVDEVVRTGIAMWMSGWYCGGEAGLISRNDGLFRIVDHLGGLSYRVRDLHDASTVVRSRVDCTMGVGGCALLLAEEKDGESVAAAISDLRRKFRWISQFGRLPYLIGFAITRNELEIFAMKPSGAMQSLFSTSLCSDANKWKCVIVCINIARVLAFFIKEKMFSTLVLALDAWHDRGNGKRLRIGMQFVEVKYDDVEVFDTLSAFYRATDRIPHLERLHVGPDVQAIVQAKRMFRLGPVGLNVEPDSEAKVVAALGELLQCLVALHALGYCHCDIRWSNIVWTESEGWFLIDCTLATSLTDTERLREMSSIIRSRYVFDSALPWSPRHDMFQLGRLLCDSEIGATPPFDQLRNYLCGEGDVDTDDVRRMISDIICDS